MSPQQKNAKLFVEVIKDHIDAIFKAADGDGVGAAQAGANVLAGVGGYVLGAAGFGPAGIAFGVVLGMVGPIINAFDDFEERATQRAKNLEAWMKRDLQLMNEM